MTRARKRELVSDRKFDAKDRADPFAGVRAIRGARVYAVGQGDGIAIIDDGVRPVLQIDYGGRGGNPFRLLKGAAQQNAVNALMPVDPNRLVMLTHWDANHWCSAEKGTQASAARWLVPRQVTSPRAVAFATGLGRISCIRETQVGQPRCFRAENGDELWWEKIGKSQTDDTKYEDCNFTGVAFSLVRRKPGRGQVILLPGDAPFASVPHYRQHFDRKLTLSGIVAFHHGADTHWTEATRALLHEWPRTRNTVPVAFSCAEKSGYPRHPWPENYRALFGDQAFAPRFTWQLKRPPYFDIDFA